MVKPNTFLVIVLSSGLRTATNIEGFNQLWQGEKLLFGARIPSQQGQEVDNGLGEIATFAIARRHFTSFGVVPFEWEHRETQSVSVAFRQFAFAFWLKQQGKWAKRGMVSAQPKALYSST